MRTIPSGSYERLSSLLALWRAYLACRRGKRRQPRMAAFDLDADRVLCALHHDLLAARYQPDPWRLRLIRDPKTRLIAAPSIRDRVLHQAILDDIHHPTLCQLLFRRLGDERTRRLLLLLVQSGGTVYRTDLAVQALELERYPLEPDCGLPLGSYLSQWCGTFYLDGLDHFIKRNLKISGYLRYMDDVALFGDERDELLQARQRIAEWLQQERRLQLNPKRWDVLPNMAPGVFLGYRVSRAGISPSRKLRRSLARRVRLAARQGYEPLVRSIRSYQGLLLF